MILMGFLIRLIPSCLFSGLKFNEDAYLDDTFESMDYYKQIEIRDGERIKIEEDLREEERVRYLVEEKRKKQ